MAKTTDVAKWLDIGESRLEQWIARGVLRPEHKPSPGLPREWAMQDLMRAAITQRLHSAGITLSAWGGPDHVLAGALSDGFHGYTGAAAILVLFAKFPGGPISKRIIPVSKLADFAATEQHAFFLAINLDRLENEIVERFPDAAPEDH